MNLFVFVVIFFTLDVQSMNALVNNVNTVMSTFVPEEKNSAAEGAPTHTSYINAIPVGMIEISIFDEKTIAKDWESLKNRVSRAFENFHFPRVFSLYPVKDFAAFKDVHVLVAIDPIQHPDGTITFKEIKVYCPIKNEKESILKPQIAPKPLPKAKGLLSCIKGFCVEPGVLFENLPGKTIDFSRLFIYKYFSEIDKIFQSIFDEENIPSRYINSERSGTVAINPNDVYISFINHGNNYYGKSVALLREPTNGQALIYQSLSKNKLKTLIKKAEDMVNDSKDFTKNSIKLELLKRAQLRQKLNHAK